MEEIILYLMVVVFGLCIGSFLNVCICRIPEGEDLVWGRSHCPKCGHVLAWYELIPVFSYLALRGKCKQCKQRISIQYPLIECLNAFCYSLIVMIHGWELDSLFMALTASVLIVISVIDIRTYEIPLGCNLIIGVIGLVRLLVEPKEWLDRGLGLISISLFLLLIYYLTHKKGIGGGDIKLMAVSGLLLGWQQNLLAFFLGCIIGSILHLLRMKFGSGKRVLAFGPYLSIGIMITMLFGEPLIQWYLNTLLG